MKSIGKWNINIYKQKSIMFTNCFFNNSSCVADKKAIEKINKLKHKISRRSGKGFITDKDGKLSIWFIKHKNKTHSYENLFHITKIKIKQGILNDIDYSLISKAIKDLHGSIHSIDQVICGKHLVEAIETPQD